jgi:hypothetical protein
MNVHYKDYLRQWRLWLSFLNGVDLQFQIMIVHLELDQFRGNVVTVNVVVIVVITMIRRALCSSVILRMGDIFSSQKYLVVEYLPQYLLRRSH